MRWIIPLLAALLFSCGSEQSRHGTFRIGIDATWSPLDFGQQQAYVNGYVEDLLLEISRYSGIEFEKISANWDSLFAGMKAGHYDAVFSSIDPYVFHTAVYDFSQNFLDLGPVLIVPWDSRLSKLNQLEGELVGILASDPAALLLAQQPTTIIRTYTSIPEVLDAVVSGEVEAALLNRLPASNYTRDLYAGRLKVASVPFTEAGLRAIVLKKKSDRFIRAFNHALEQMKKKKIIEKLQTKWNLS